MEAAVLAAHRPSSSVVRPTRALLLGAGSVCVCVGGKPGPPAAHQCPRPGPDHPRPCPAPAGCVPAWQGPDRFWETALSWAAWSRPLLIRALGEGPPALTHGLLLAPSGAWASRPHSLEGPPGQVTGCRVRLCGPAGPSPSLPVCRTEVMTNDGCSQPGGEWAVSPGPRGPPSPQRGLAPTPTPGPAWSGHQRGPHLETIAPVALKDIIKIYWVFLLLPWLGRNPGWL